MKPYNVVTVVCVIIMLVSTVGTAYAQYSSTLTDRETVAVENHYGTATLTESSGTYTLNYIDTTADTVYLTVTVSGLASDTSAGGIVDLWLGAENALSEFSGTYSATVDGTELTVLTKTLTASGSTYTDGSYTYTVTYSDSTVSVTGGESPAVLAGTCNFTDGGRLYVVTVTDGAVTGVSKVIPVEGSSGSYVFDDDGYRYVITCSGSSVTAAMKCEVVSATVDSYGTATFNAWVTDLDSKNWSSVVYLYYGETALTFGDYYVNATFYSSGTSTA